MEQDNQTPEQQPINLSLQDLLLVVQTLQVVTQRGAIRADEMTNIGGLYDRLVNFLTASGAIKPAGGEEPTEPDQGE
jgi:hypothetical protein